MKRFVIEREMFDEDQTYWDRALNVDVLVIDDLGKGTQDSTGLGARLIDELIRHRNASKLVTIITTNMNQRDLAEELKVSTMSSLKEHVFPIHVSGIDRRDSVAVGMSKSLFDQ
jgi:DNA replication protein DnaC